MKNIQKVEVKRKVKENALVPKLKKPPMPKEWNYEQSVKKVKQLIYRWKKLTPEMAEELWIAREELSAQGMRTDLTSGEFTRSWEQYCEEIGTTKWTVNNWLNRIYGSVKERTKAKLLPPPKGKYRTIVIDPPWPMEKILREAYPNQQKDLDYQTMEVEEIQKLELPIYKKGCNIFLWTTHKFLPIAFELFKEWGIKYICTFVWHKAGGFQPWNLPQYNCEFVLFGRIGTLKFKSTKEFMCCFIGKRGRHSEKPNEFYEMIKRVSPAPRIDMFARRAHNGFEKWPKKEV